MAKAKKKQLSEAAQQKRSQQSKKRLNPFEVHINRDKQNVLGRKSKSDKGLPGVSRTKAINKRKKTLLHEFKMKNKDNVFLDKRIGEKNALMSEEEKIMARFAKEKIKAHRKKNIYNLNEEEVLTHRGQTLEEIEKFDDPRSDDEFSDSETKNGKLEDGFVSDAHFGGGVLSRGDGVKSRKDLIDQLIAESKKRKAEKQKIREETMDLTDKLDTEWRDLLPIISASNKTMEEQEKAAEEAKIKEQKEQSKEKPDDYDMEVRKLKFEARGTPTDKLKSEEELVREEKEKLEKLEADRIQRMKGFVSDNDDRIKHKSADDLDDDFLVERIHEEKEDQKDEEGGRKEDEDSGDEEEEEEEEEKEEEKEEEEEDEEEKEEEEIEKEEEEEEEEEEADEEENQEESSDEDNLSDLKDSTSSSDEEEEEEGTKKSVKFADSASSAKEASNSTELRSILKTKRGDSKTNSDASDLTGAESRKENEKGEERQARIREDLLKRKEIMEKARKELPYTFKVPESYEELQKLLEKHNADYQSVIIDRMIKCNHWTLDGRNKEKLSNLLLYLLQHLNNCALGDGVEAVLHCFNVLDRLAPYLYDLAHVVPENTRTFFQEIIKEKHEEFEKNKKKYPGLDTLVFLKLVSLIFPTSDFRHPVATPCLVFMSQILLRSRVKGRADLSKGLFICALMLEYTVLSKRVPPSAVNFLRGVIFYSTPKHLIQGQRMIPPFKTAGDAANLLLLEKEASALKMDESDTRMKAEDLISAELTDDYKIRSLSTAVRMLQEFKENFVELEAAYAIFEPVHKLLRQNKFEEYPCSVRKSLKKFRKELEELREKKLRYLVLEKKRPKPLRMYEPRIEAVYDGKKRKPMSREKAEREKLLHKYKKEMKGAVREIRRDNAFLAKVQIKQQIRSDQERKRKVKEIFGEAAVQQSELKRMKRKK